jgi:hypothetical protein
MNGDLQRTHSCDHTGDLAPFTAQQNAKRSQIIRTFRNDGARPHENSEPQVIAQLDHPPMRVRTGDDGWTEVSVLEPQPDDRYPLEPFA